MKTWAELWEHVKATRPDWRIMPPLGAVQEDGGRLVLLRQQGAAKAGSDLRGVLIYLETSGAFVDVASEDAMSGRVVLVDGRVIGASASMTPKEVGPT